MPITVPGNGDPSEQSKGGRNVHLQIFTLRPLPSEAHQGLYENKLLIYVGVAKAVLGISDILLRIRLRIRLRIWGSVPLTNVRDSDPHPASDPANLVCDL